MLLYRCDADPSALANYVVALVKKDKPEKDLKALCADQLDVFLQKGKDCVRFCPFMSETIVVLSGKPFFPLTFKYILEKFIIRFTTATVNKCFLSCHGLRYIIQQHIYMMLKDQPGIQTDFCFFFFCLGLTSSRGLSLPSFLGS